VLYPKTAHSAIFLTRDFHQSHRQQHVLIIFVCTSHITIKIVAARCRPPSMLPQHSSPQPPPQCQSMTTPFPTVRPAVCKKIHCGCRLIKKLVSTLFVLLIRSVHCRHSQDWIVLWSLITNPILTDWQLHRRSGILSLAIQ